MSSVELSNMRREIAIAVGDLALTKLVAAYLTLEGADLTTEDLVPEIFVEGDDEPSDSSDYASSDS